MKRFIVGALALSLAGCGTLTGLLGGGDTPDALGSLVTAAQVGYETYCGQIGGSICTRADQAAAQHAATLADEAIAAYADAYAKCSQETDPAAKAKCQPDADAALKHAQALVGELTQLIEDFEKGGGGRHKGSGSAGLFSYILTLFGG